MLGAESSKPVVCYYTYHGAGNLTPDQLEAGLCSHLIVGFADVSREGLVDDRGNRGIYEQTARLKTKQNDLKVMLSVGGGGAGSGFSQAVVSPNNRARLIKSILELVKDCGLDGVDLDWEFPGWNTPSTDKTNFAVFIQEFREALKGEYSGMILSVAVANKLPIIMASYNVSGLARDVDFINLMAYDFHGYSKLEDPFTGFNSPLYPRKAEISYFATLNTAWAANYWAQIGMPREKIMVGIPTYAITYVLADPIEAGLDAKAVGGGDHWSYSSVCEFIEMGASTIFDEESLVPFAVKGVDWVSYENERSVTEKVKFVLNEKFGGVMTFSLNADDVTGACGRSKFPLHKEINKNIKALFV